jgi:dUTP pyrophosphatase
MIKVKIKKLNPEANIPAYAKEGDAGLDLVAISKRETEKFIEYGTGLAIEIPEGHMGLLFPRSSISKKDLVLANSVGIVDAGYRGELLIRFKKLGEDNYEVGERVVQLMVMPFPKINFEEVEELEDSSRGAGGFGSTGSK